MQFSRSLPLALLASLALAAPQVCGPAETMTVTVTAPGSGAGQPVALGTSTITVTSTSTETSTSTATQTVTVQPSDAVSPVDQSATDIVTQVIASYTTTYTVQVTQTLADSGATDPSGPVTVGPVGAQSQTGIADPIGTQSQTNLVDPIGTEPALVSTATVIPLATSLDSSQNSFTVPVVSAPFPTANASMTTSGSALVGPIGVSSTSSDDDCEDMTSTSASTNSSMSSSTASVDASPTQVNGTSSSMLTFTTPAFVSFTPPITLASPSSTPTGIADPTGASGSSSSSSSSTTATDATSTTPSSPPSTTSAPSLTLPGPGSVTVTDFIPTTITVIEGGDPFGPILSLTLDFGIDGLPSPLPSEITAAAGLVIYGLEEAAPTSL